MFPTGLAALRVERNDDLIVLLAVHGVERVAVVDDAGIAFTERSIPELLGTTGRPGLREPGRVRMEVPIRSSPLIPARGASSLPPRASRKTTETDKMPIEKSFFIAIHLLSGVLNTDTLHRQRCRTSFSSTSRRHIEDT